jgi:adenosine kinase
MNTIRCTNFMLKAAGHEGKCLYFGSISEDEIGQKMRDLAEAEGLHTNFSVAEENYTGKCACVIHEKERALCADLGASCAYKTEHMTENISQAASAKIIYTTGFFITSNFEALMTAGRYAHENGIPFAINLSALFLIHGHKEQFLEMVKLASYVFGNEDEVKAWGEAHGYTFETLHDICEEIAKIEKTSAGPRHVIITQGKEPVLYAKHDPATGETERKTFEIELVEADKVEDLNGAGDAFVGGFLAQFV